MIEVTASVTGALRTLQKIANADVASASMPPSVAALLPDEVGL
jgi:hypothetical protein